jgi:hypothetical protein
MDVEDAQQEKMLVLSVKVTLIISLLMKLNAYFVINQDRLAQMEDVTIDQKTAIIEHL